MYSVLLLQMNAEKMHLTFTLSKNLKKKRRKLAASLSIASTCSITIRPPGLRVSYSPQTGGTRDNFLRTRRLRNLCSRSAAPVSEGGRRGRTAVCPEQLLGSSQQQKDKERTREGRERFSILAVSGRVNEELFFTLLLLLLLLEGVLNNACKVYRRVAHRWENMRRLSTLNVIVKHVKPGVWTIKALRAGWLSGTWKFRVFKGENARAVYKSTKTNKLNSHGL